MGDGDGDGDEGRKWVMDGYGKSVLTQSRQATISTSSRSSSLSPVCVLNTKKYSRPLWQYVFCPPNSIYLPANEINETEGGIVTTRMCQLYVVDTLRPWLMSNAKTMQG